MMSPQEPTPDPQQLAAENQRLKAILHISRTLADPDLELSRKLQACVEELARITQAEKASLMLLEGDELVVRAATNPHIVGMATPLDQDSISTEVYRTGSPFYAKDLGRSALAPLSRQGDQSSYRTGSLISLPLMDQGGVVGVLNLSDRVDAPYFGEKDLELAQDIAAQVARLVNFCALHGRLDAAYRELSRTQKAKDDLMAMVIHDLKAPVISAKELLGLLENSPRATPQERAQYLDLAQSELELLWRRISNLLDLNRLDTNQYPFNPTPVRLGTLVRETLDRLEALRRVNQVEVELTLHDDPELLADEDLLERMVGNLLSNAYKVSAPEQGGGGRVRVEVASADGQAKIEVHDSGPGVDPELGQAIFERFSQTKLEKGASGLGLHFSRRAAWLHGGEVDYRNLPGGGACFWLGLPLPPPAE